MLKKKRSLKKNSKKNNQNALPVFLFGVLLLGVVFFVINFYFTFLGNKKILVLSSTVSNLQTVSSFQKELTFKFSGRIDKDLIEKSFRIHPSVLGVSNWKDDRTFSFQLEDDLKDQTKYSVSFLLASLPSPFFPTTAPELYNLQFETGESPKVLSTSPTDLEEDVELGKYIIFNFDQEIQDKDLDKYFFIKPEISGKLIVKGKSLIFIPDEKLLKNETYLVGVFAGILGANSQQLSNDHFVNFSTKKDDEAIQKDVRKVKLPILMYHNVGRISGGESQLTRRFKIDPIDLEKQLDYISENYNPVSMEDLYGYLTNDVALPDNPIVLTFDDGWKGVYEDAFPILKSKKMEFTLYLISSYLDKNSAYLTKDHVREMLKSGLLEIGNHTMSHMLLAFSSEKDLLSQVSAAQRQLYFDFGVMPQTFAYPGGSYNKTVVDRIEKLGFKTAVTVSAGVEQREDELLLLKRIEIEGTDGIQELENKLNLSQ